MNIKFDVSRENAVTSVACICTGLYVTGLSVLAKMISQPKTFHPMRGTDETLQSTGELISTTDDIHKHRSIGHILGPLESMVQAQLS